MRKKNFKLVVLLLSFIIMIGLTACQTVTNTNPGNPTTKPEEVTQTPKKEVSFTFMLNYAAPDYPEDGGIGKKRILEKFTQNVTEGIVDYKVLLATGDEYFTKLNLLGSSGDLPDYFELNLETMHRFADSDLIIQLDNLLENAPHMKNVIKESALQIVRYNKKLYAFPRGVRPEPLNGPCVDGFSVRQDWLDNLGLKQPKTLDDYFNVLKAFTFDDPDQNGKDDTYGMGASKESQFIGVFGAFGVTPNAWLERDGKLHQGATLPEAKKALQVLQQWYAAGVIDPDFLLLEKKQRDEKIINSQVGMFEGSGFNMNPLDLLYSPLLANNPKANLIMLVPPEGPEGHKGWKDVAPGTNVVSSISKKCKEPELLVKFLDWVADDSDKGGFYLTHHAFEDVNDSTRYDKEKNRIMEGKTAAEYNAMGYGNPAKFYATVDRRWMPETSMVAMDITNKYIIKSEFFRIVPAMTDYPDLNIDQGKLWKEYFIKIVVGTLPVDAWDEYVTKYYNQGGKEIQEQVNAEWNALK